MALEHLAPGAALVSGASLRLTAQQVHEYLAAVGNDQPLYQLEGAPVPPEAIAARVIREFLARLSLPPGATHIAQEMECLAPCPPEAGLVLDIQVTHNFVRGERRFLGIAYEVRENDRQVVLRGRSTALLPPQAQRVLGAEPLVVKRGPCRSLSCPN